MTTNELLQRVNELKAAVEASAANHNALFGRLNEAQYLLEASVAAEAKAIQEKMDIIEEQMSQPPCETEHHAVA